MRRDPQNWGKIASSLEPKQPLGTVDHQKLKKMRVSFCQSHPSTRYQVDPQKLK